MLDSKQKVVKSSYVQAYSYDADTKILDVTFMNGTEYKYTGIQPDQMSNVFDTSGSVGKKFRSMIKQDGVKALKTS